jgi:hypothetical protein
MPQKLYRLNKWLKELYSTYKLRYFFGYNFNRKIFFVNF